MPKNRTVDGDVGKLVAAFLAAGDGLSPRELQRQSGVNHETIRQLRAGAELRLHHANRRRMQSFIDVSRETATVRESAPGYGGELGLTERAALLVAADRLEMVAAQLRAEAEGTGAPPAERVSQAKRVAEAVREVQHPTPQKRAGRKGG